MRAKQPKQLTPEELQKQIKEYMDKLQESRREFKFVPFDTRPTQPTQPTQPHVCPNCGHCPTCGRRNLQPWPTQPRHPWQEDNLPGPYRDPYREPYHELYHEPYRFGDPYYERFHPVWVYQPTITTDGTPVTVNTALY